MRSGTHPPRVDRPASRAPTRSGRYSRNSDTDSGEEDGPSGVTAVLGEDRPGRLWGKASFSHTRTPCDDASTGGRRNKCAKCGDCRSLVHTVPQGARTAGDDFAGTGGLPERRRLGSSLGSPGPSSRCHARARSPSDQWGRVFRGQNADTRVTSSLRRRRASRKTRSGTP